MRAFEEYVQAVHEASLRVERMTSAVAAELGDFARFESARKLMGYLGLVPSEDSSGPRRRQGPITKAGNSSARRALVEAARAYVHPARVSWVIARRQVRPAA